CHGPELQMAELRLDQRKFVVDDVRGLLKSGKSSESLLIQRLTDKKLGLIMPPTFPFFPGEKPGLPETQISVLKSWIDQGATWPEGVSLVSDAAGGESSAAKALRSAIRAGNHASVITLIANNRDIVNTRDKYGDTPLMH